MRRSSIVSVADRKAPRASAFGGTLPHRRRGERSDQLSTSDAKASAGIVYDSEGTADGRRRWDRQVLLEHGRLRNLHDLVPEAIKEEEAANQPLEPLTRSAVASLFKVERLWRAPRYGSALSFGIQSVRSCDKLSRYLSYWGSRFPRRLFSLGCYRVFGTGLRRILASSQLDTLHQPSGVTGLCSR